MSYADERAYVGAVLADWTRCPILWPASDLDGQAIAPSADPMQPTCYLAVEVGRDSEGQIAARGLRQINGSVRAWIWVEARLGDGVVEEIADQLAAVFAAAPPVAGWYWTDYRLGEPVREGGFYGAEWRQSFIRFEQSAAAGGSG